MGSADPAGPTRGRGKWPFGLLGMIVLVALAEKGVQRRGADLEKVGGCWGQSASHAAREGAKAEILIFGDSLAKYALQPRVIGEKAGLSAYNLAGYAAPPAYDYFLLRRVLAAGGRPRAILINLQPFYVPSYHRLFDYLFAEFVTPAEALDLAWAERSPEFFGRLLAMRALASARHRDSIRTRVLQGLSGGESHMAEITAAFRRNWARNGGGHAQQVEPHATQDAAEGVLAQWSGLPADTGPSDRIHGRYVERFLALAASRQIPVYVLMPPMLPAIQARRDSGGYRDHETSRVRRIVDRYSNVTVLEGRQAGYDHRLFAEDLIHMNARGAVALSADVGDVLRQALVEGRPAARWVDLPEYGNRTMNPALETFVESQLRVRERAIRR